MVLPKGKRKKLPKIFNYQLKNKKSNVYMIDCSALSLCRTFLFHGGYNKLKPKQKLIPQIWINRFDTKELYSKN